MYLVNFQVNLTRMCILCCWNIVVQLLSCVQLFATPWIEAHQTSLSITISLSVLELMSIESVMLLLDGLFYIL